MKLVAALLLWISSAKVTAQPAPAPALTMIGTAGDRLDVTTAERVTKARLFVVPNAALDDLRVTGSLLGPNGIDGKLERTGATATTTAPAGQPLTIDLSVELPLAGTYNGIVTLASKQLTKSYPVQATRTPVAPAIDALVPDTVRSQSWRTRDATLRFEVRDRGGRALALLTPELIGVAAKNGAPVANIKATLDDKCDAETGLTVAANGRAICDLSITSPAAGQLSGKLRFKTADSLPLDVSLTLSLRDPMLSAVLAIVAGMVLSFLLHTVLKRKVAHLNALRRLAPLVDAFEAAARGPLSPPQATVVSQLRQQIKDAYAMRDAPFDVLTLKLQMAPVWLALSRRLAQLWPRSIANAYEAKLQPIAASFALEAQDVDKLKPAATDLAAIGPALDDEVLKTVTAGVQDLGADVNQLVRDPARPGGGSDAATLRSVSAALDEANAAIALKRPQEAAAAFARAQKLFLPVAIGRLRARLAPITCPPGMDNDNWPALKKQVGDRLSEAEQQADPEAEAKAYHQALADFLGTVIRALKTEATQQSKQDAVTLADAAQTSLDAGRMRDAIAKYDEGRGKIAAGKVMGIDGKEVSIQAVTGAKALIERVRDVAAEAPLPSLATLERRIATLGWVSGIALFVITLVAGVVFLWCGNASWGSGADYASAVLWGLGITQVGAVGWLTLATQLGLG